MPSFVYLSLPANGHLTPSFPILVDLVRRNHQVHCFSLEPFRRGIEQTGAIFHGYGSRFKFPSSGPGPFARLDTTVERLIDLTHIVLEDHLDVISELQPACILHDSFAPWGRFIAQALRVPSVASVPSIAVNEQIARGTGALNGGSEAAAHLIAEWMPSWCSALAQLNRQFGVSAIMNPLGLMHAYGDLNLVYTSRAFQPMADAFDEDRFKFIGPLIADRKEGPAFPFEALDERPLLFISLGSVYNDRGPFFQSCAEAFAGSPWQVVMAVGQNLTTDLTGSFPENFLVRDWVPQIEILRRASIFITHGGMNSVNEALWHGVPMLVVPQGADQFWIAHRIAGIGAGMNLAGIEATPKALRQSADSLASQPSYAQAAVAMGNSLRRAGGVHLGGDAIEALLNRIRAR